MFETSQQPVWERTLIAAFLDALFNRPAAALLDGGIVRLFTAGPAPVTPNSEITDFTEATFEGYTSQGLVAPADLSNAPSGNSIGWLQNFLWTLGSPPAGGQTILGYYVVSGSPLSLVFAEYFPAPVALANAGDFLSLDLFSALNFVADVVSPA